MDNKTYLPNVASFLVTEDCNLRCTYCFEKHNKNKMTKEVARKGLDLLCQNALKNGDDYFSAMIFGGEPLLAPDIVEEIFKHGLELAEKNNIQFTCSMVTNATILTDKVKRILKKYRKKVNLNVQLSIDGIKEVHDKYRVTTGGKGSFDTIEKNIPHWKALFADNIDALSVHGCCNKDTLPFLFENYLFFREEWEIPRIWFMPIHSEEWTEEDVKIYEEQLGKIADYILEDVKKTGNYQEVINYAPIDRCLGHDSFPSAPCGAGKSFMTITAKGDLYPCHQIYFNDPNEYTKIGNLDVGIDELARKLYVDLDNSDFSCAKLDPDCDAYACYRCMGDNLTENGSILSTVDCQGARCLMSKVERKIQLKIRRELEKMGLINRRETVNTAMGNNPNNPDCLCDVRSYGDFMGNNSNVRMENVGEHNCQCGDKHSDNETIAMALKLILDKIDTIEKGQEYLLKKIVK